MSEQKQNNAEIDLYYFFKPLGTALKKLGHGMEYASSKLRANALVFCLIVLLVSLAGYSARYIVKPSYQTHGIFVSDILPGKYCSILLQNLNAIKGAGNRPLLAQQLKISNEAAEDIQGISMSDMRDTFLVDRKDSTLSLFRISLTLRSVQHLDTIQWGLVNYLENNEYAIKRKEAKIIALEALKSTLNSKLLSLDSLKKIVNNSIMPRSQGNGIILGEPIDPVSVYQAEMSYYRERLNIDQALATIDNIEVIQPFLKISHPNYPSYGGILSTFFIVALASAALVVLLFGRRPKLKT